MLRIIAIILASLIAGAVYSDNPASTQLKEGQSKQAHFSKTNKGNTDQRGTEKSPLIVKGVPSESGDTRTAREGENTNNKPFLEWNIESVSLGISALATIVIAIFTIALSCSTKRLWQETKASSAIANKSADAAKQTADAVIGVELPRFIMVSMRFDIHNMNLERALYDSSVLLYLTNHGRTEGIIVEKCLTWQVTQALDPEPRYPISDVEKVDFGSVIKKNENYEIRKRFFLSDELAQRVKTKQAILWIYGYIKYRDFLEKCHRTGFCAALELFADKMYPSASDLGKFVEQGPYSYTYSKYEEC